ncbi:MAG TPA: hypothetical protein VI072_12210 [Polyangiaceae bacterium]
MARAESPARRPLIELYAPPCRGDPYDRAALVEALSVEAAALGVSTVVGKALEPGVVVSNELLAAVLLNPEACTAGALELTVALFDARFCGRATRSIALGDLDGAGRHRALAIAIVELLQANWANHALKADAVPTARSIDAREPRTDSSSSQAPSSPAAATMDAETRSPNTTAPAPVRPNALRLHGGAQAQTFLGRKTALFGPELGIQHPLLPNLGVEFGASLGFGERGDSSASAMMLTLTSVGVPLWSSSAPAFQIGPRLHAGVVRGDVSNGGIPPIGFVLLGGAGATGAVTLAPQWNALLGIELGAAIVRADASWPANDYAVRGVYVTSRLGIGTDL